MGKTYKKFIKNKFEKRKFQILKQKKLRGEEEDDERTQEEIDLSTVSDEDRTHESV